MSSQNLATTTSTTSIPSTTTTTPGESLPRVESDTKKEIPVEATSSNKTPEVQSDVPSYILRKEEAMRRANGVANTTTSLNISSPSPPEIQRRDSRTLSDAPKPNASTTPTSTPAEPEQKNERLILF